MIHFVFLSTFKDYTEDAPDDEKIRREIVGLQVAIINHARDYHHQGPIRCAVVEIEKLLLRERELFPNLSTIEFAQLFCDAATRRSAITGLISHMLLKNIGFYGTKMHTLLPPSVLENLKSEMRTYNLQKVRILESFPN